MRDTFVNTLTAMAEQDPNICLLTADLGFGVLKPFWSAHPDRFFNLGIAEQNLTSMAAGLALWGKTAVTYSIGNFPTLRCLGDSQAGAGGHCCPGASPGAGSAAGESVAAGNCPPDRFASGPVLPA